MIINPSFLNKTLLNRVLLSSIDLENTIKSFLGMNILNYRVINKRQDYITIAIICRMWHGLSVKI